jgi:hypothetical protein
MVTERYRDFVGVAMGFVTIPMAILSVASLAGGAWLLAIGAWRLVLLSVAPFGLCVLMSPLLEQLIVYIDHAAAVALGRHDRGQARLIAIVSGALPVLVILAWEYGCFRAIMSTSFGVPVTASWLWSYGVATGPWTLLAARVSRFRRTLCGIRAYAGHLAYWLLSFEVLIVGASPVVGAASMLLPAILPFTVGLLLALADRDALTNVRV